MDSVFRTSDRFTRLERENTPTETRLIFTLAMENSSSGPDASENMELSIHNTPGLPQTIVPSNFLPPCNQPPPLPPRPPVK